ncbi:MAG: dihydropteroate synthase [Bacteroidota bacterium]|nr:MAG: dihydropteroate synthase [Bacteroidota bacterium]
MKRTLNCKGKLIDLNEPKVMGILNITPDSFYDKSRLRSKDDLLKRTESMLSEGATFIDIGAYSSRPGAEFVSEEEERKRLIPALEIILKEFPDVLLSVDTFRSNIARETIDLGASMINDISGGDMDAEMYDVVVNKQVPYILMHMRGNPQNMSNLDNYNHLIIDIISELQVKVNDLKKRGLNDIIIDPGLGFAKNLLQNYEIINKLKSLKCIGHPLLIGASRKSMIYKLLRCEPKSALNGTTVVNTACLLNGASILRVHDVKEAVEAIKITNLLKK